MDFHEAMSLMQSAEAEQGAASPASSARLEVAGAYIRSSWQFAQCQSLFGAVVLAESKTVSVPSGNLEKVYFYDLCGQVVALVLQRRHWDL